MAKSRAEKQQQQLRVAGRRARANLNQAERDRASEIITEKVIRSHWFQRAEYIACYLPATDEVDTWAIIARAWRMKKRIFAPVVEKKFRMQFREITADTSLYQNQFGLLEPDDGELMSARMLDVVLTPLVAFDPFLHRVGMGGGYFDRTFSFLKHREHFFRPKLTGLAFACQKVEEISANPWDIRLFSVITDSGPA
jgi:5-formyltetrahydrofolate cyclo-ligase